MDSLLYQKILERYLLLLFRNQPWLISDSMKDIKHVIDQLIVDMFVVVYQQVLQKPVEILCLDTRHVWYIAE